MGAYINPKSMPKEAWLAANSKGHSHTPPERFDEHPGHLPVCLVDNGAFTAAGIAFDQRELDGFTEPGDPRPKTWIWVEVERLLDPDISNLADYCSPRAAGDEADHYE